MHQVIFENIFRFLHTPTALAAPGLLVTPSTCSFLPFYPQMPTVYWPVSPGPPVSPPPGGPGLLNR